MNLGELPFSATDWTCVSAVQVPGETGWASTRSQQVGPLRMRMVDYSPGYVADHWSRRGQVLMVLDGELEAELEDGRTYVLRPGMSYQVGDGMEPHRARSLVGARLFIVD